MNELLNRVPPLPVRLATGLLTALLAACHGGSGESPAPLIDEPRRTVRIATVGSSAHDRVFQLPGVLRPVRRAAPAFLQSGYLAERFVRRGDRVVTGQPLAVQANPSLGPGLVAARARITEIEARLGQLDIEYQRVLALETRGLTSADQLDRALAARDAARAAREQAIASKNEAETRLLEATLRAPFDAVVGDLQVEPGDFVNAGQSVMTLAGDGPLEVEIRIPETLSGRLDVSLPAQVRLLATGESHPAEIREIGVARDSRLAPVVVELPAGLTKNDGWAAGASVQVVLSLAEKAVLTVPLSAIIDPGTGQTRVFRVVSERAVLTPVHVGGLVGPHVEVHGELSKGDLVVVAGHQQLLDGDLVRILP